MGNLSGILPEGLVIAEAIVSYSGRGNSTGFMAYSTSWGALKHVIVKVTLAVVTAGS